jgi:hypothetical protein
MTVLFKNLRAFGYSEHTGPLRGCHSGDVAGTETLLIHQTQCSSWPVAHLESQVISPVNSCLIHAVSCLLLSSSYVSSGLTVPYSFLWCLFPGGTIIHYRRTTHHIVSPSAGDFSHPSTSLNAHIVRLFGSQPWIDALSLLIMSISWLGKARCVRATQLCADYLKALAAWTRLVIWFPRLMPNG